MRTNAVSKLWIIASILVVTLTLSCGDDVTAPEENLPEITSITPAAGTIGTDVNIIIIGSKLTGATLTSSEPEVTISGITAAATEIAATLSISESATAGNITITATTSEGSATVIFLLELPDAPSISSISPSVGEIGDNVDVQITGENLTGATVTSSDSVAVVIEVTSVSATSIDATFTLNSLAFPGSVDITVTTIGGSATEGFSLDPAGLGGLVWSQGPDITTLRALLSAVEVGGKVYALGGYDFVTSTSLDVVEVFDPANNTWTTESSMTTARYVAGVVAVDGKIYLAGGDDGEKELSLLDVFNPASHTWTSLQSMPTERGALGLGVAGNKLYAIGGANSDGLQAVNESYDVENLTWTTLASMPGARSAISVVSTAHRIYVVGGHDGSQYVSTLQYYNIDENNWTTATSMPTERWLSTSTLYLGNILVIGGWTSGYVSTDVVEALNPATNTWSTPPSLPDGRDRAAIAVVDRKIYIIGGSKWVEGSAELQASTLVGELP